MCTGVETSSIGGVSSTVEVRRRWARGWRLAERSIGRRANGVTIVTVAEGANIEKKLGAEMGNFPPGQLPPTGTTVQP
jgi:hypothetical protein